MNQLSIARWHHDTARPGHPTETAKRTNHSADVGRYPPHIRWYFFSWNARPQPALPTARRCASPAVRPAIHCFGHRHIVHARDCRNVHHEPGIGARGTGQDGWQPAALDMVIWDAIGKTLTQPRRGNQPASDVQWLGSAHPLHDAALVDLDLAQARVQQGVGDLVTVEEPHTERIGHQVAQAQQRATT